MGFISWLKQAVSPARLATRLPVVSSQPLWAQFCRIGGSLTPEEVTWIIRRADAGYPRELVDLGNEGRSKDGHLQGILSIRDASVAQCPVDFIVPERSNQRKLKKDKRAVDLCQRVVDEFDNWPVFIEHLTGAYFPGHATAQLYWRKTKDGFLLPYKADALRPRDFVFSQLDGQLRYSPPTNLSIELDLLAENPGRIVQVQRRIVGDAQVREGLIRLLVWAALFRNWTLKDWLSLGEVGWKPWRTGSYDRNASDEDILALENALATMGTTGVAVLPETAKVNVEWPKGMAAGTGGSSSHRELFDVMGREMSKAVLGTTTSIESGPNGTKGDTHVRDALRTDKREQDAVAVSAALKSHLFNFVVAVNLGDDVLVPTPWFQTDESQDQLAFASAVQKLQLSGVRIPAKWVRDEVGMPEPKDGEEVLAASLNTTDGVAQGAADGNPKDPASAEDQAPPQGD